jgi:hypothetical protein
MKSCWRRLRFHRWKQTDSDLFVLNGRPRTYVLLECKRCARWKIKVY